MIQNRIERVFARVFLVCVSIVITFLIVDLASRPWITTKSSIEDYLPVNEFRHLKPYVMVGARSNRKRGLNAMGYRCNIPHVPKDPSEFRIFMLGGSTTLLGNPPIAGWIQKEFELAGHPNVKVYNYGVLSSVSGMELARIVFEIADQEPDLVIMYDGGNDIIVPWESDPRPGYPMNFIVYENNPLAESTPKTYPTFTLFAYGSNLLRYIFHDYFSERFIHLNQVRKEIGWKSQPWREKIAAIYASNIVKASKASAAFGAEYIGFYQPMIFFKEPLSPQEEMEERDQEQIEYAQDMRKRMISKLRGAAMENKLNWVDLSRIYHGRSQRVFTDIIHTTDPAKRVVAAAIYKEINQLCAEKIVSHALLAQKQ